MRKSRLKRAGMLLICTLTACAMIMTTGCSSSDTDATNANANAAELVSGSPVADDVTAAEATGAFSADGDGDIEENNGIYTIRSAGTYSFEGLLNGQILVDAGDDDDVILELNGATIVCGKDSPIKILNCSSVDISAKGGTENVIKDERSEKTTDDDAQGSAAIYAKADLKLKGTGTLVVYGSYYNGVQTTKDLSIQKLRLKVTAVNNALKGGDSFTLKSGKVIAISTKGDGVKTKNTDADKNGNVRGDITLTAGEIAVYAAGDGFQAAHNFIFCADEDGNEPTAAVYTGGFSAYTDSGAAVTSSKGVKVKNLLNVSAGTIVIQSYDDGLNADKGANFEAGGKGEGSISISGGIVQINVYAPESGSTGGGRGGQQTVKGADGIHADNKLNISGGSISVVRSYEGLEANVINISGGSTYVYATDDGVNTCKGSETPAVNVTGGYLDVAVLPNGGTDGIDSNGTYSQSGGVVITRGPNSKMMAAIDADKSVTVSGGTLIVMGYGIVKTSGSVKSDTSLSLHAAGAHTVKIGNVSYTFTNAVKYAKTIVYSDTTVSA